MKKKRSVRIINRNTFLFLHRKTQTKLELVRTHHTVQINLLIDRLRIISILHIEKCI